MKLTVADDRRCLQRDGKPFFWLADTLWSAFTNMTDEELESYLILAPPAGVQRAADQHSAPVGPLLDPGTMHALALQGGRYV